MNKEQLRYVIGTAQKYDYGDGIKWDRNHAEKVADLTESIMTQLLNLDIMALADVDLLLARAIALPHDIGRNPNAKGYGKKEHNKCSFETLQEELTGSPLNEDEATIIQYCALFHRGDEWKHITVPRKQDLTMRLAGILRIADGLDNELSQKVKDIVLSIKGKEITCEVIATSSADQEINRAKKKKDLFEKAFSPAIAFIKIEMARN